MWTLEQLVVRVGAALGVGYDGAPNGRVREVPDGRVVRYYTTLGLVDRPVIEGRVAMYGERHLAQVVAIKRLQAEGQTLARVQEALAGVGERALERIAAVPRDVEERAARREKGKEKEKGEEREQGAGVGVDRGRRREGFWKVAAAEVGESGAGMVGVRIAPGIVLLVEGIELSAADVEAFRAVVEARGLGEGKKS